MGVVCGRGGGAMAGWARRGSRQLGVPAARHLLVRRRPGTWAIDARRSMGSLGRDCRRRADARAWPMGRDVILISASVMMIDIVVVGASSFNDLRLQYQYAINFWH